MGVFKIISKNLSHQNIIWIDCKNLVLYNGGISLWLESNLNSLNEGIKNRSVIVAPNFGNHSGLNDFGISIKKLPWFRWLPRKINILIYDLITLKLYSFFNKPKLVFSPYFDVRISRRASLITTIHDLCHFEIPKDYSYLTRIYFSHAIKNAISKSIFICTVSENSKRALISKMSVPEDKIKILPNRLNREFANYSPTEDDIFAFKEKFKIPNNYLLYTAGYENRKNFPLLLSAFKKVISNYDDIYLMLSGNIPKVYLNLIYKMNIPLNKILMPGRLSNSELKIAYLQSRVVICPSKSEGFGRSLLEAIATNRPLICSNIQIFHEIAGSAAKYFEKDSSEDLFKCIIKILQEKNTKIVDYILPTDNSTDHLGNILGECLEVLE